MIPPWEYRMKRAQILSHIYLREPISLESPQVFVI